MQIHFVDDEFLPQYDKVNIPVREELIVLIDKKSDFEYKGLTFDEIDQGFTTKEAITEAKRCLNCPKPMCRQGCPIENEIPDFIKALSKGNIGEASAINIF